MKKITIQESNELFIDTLKKAYLSLLTEKDEVIEHNIFEEFDIGVHTFLYHDNLLKLLNAQLIDEEIFQLAETLRTKVLLMQANHQWTIEAFKNAKEWREILLLSENTMVLKINFDKQHS